ncbi:MAG: hypothetical protein IPN89_16410 [Saprospiraceae bacterium]|nr:hypothetical protein [Saprospiraceae bacterium]
MAIKIKLSNHDQVKEFYGLLNHPLKEVMMELDQIILETDPEIGEQINGNRQLFTIRAQWLTLTQKSIKGIF